MTVSPVPLSRSTFGRPFAPARIVHVGLGAFHRAHQAWYTAHARDAREWGIVAFSGRDSERSGRLVDALNRQDGLYTVVQRGPSGDDVEVVDSIVAAHSLGDVPAVLAHLADPRTAIVSTTVTEAGYRVDPGGRPRADDPVVASDLDALRSGSLELVSPLALIARGLDERRLAGAGAVSVMPCDNMPDNGDLVRAGLLAFAASIDDDLPSWIADNVGFVSTSVDRITPRFAEADLATVRAAGYDDAVPVVTEPFADWVMCGEFVAGRPDWESAGARFADDLEPFENRKLWLLNGSHTGMANLGLTRGIGTVAEATADGSCRAMVEAFWDEAARHLPQKVEAERYRRDLWERFENPRIAHNLAQIAEDSATKLGVRVAPVALAERRAGRTAAGCAQVIAAWVRRVCAGDDILDSRQAAIDEARNAPDPTAALVTVVDAELGTDGSFLSEVRSALTS